MRVVLDVWAARRTPRPARLVAALLSLALFGLAPAAAADKARADALFDEGKTLLQANDWAGACVKFQASFEADPAVSTSVKLARCREHEGLLVAALAEYRRARELNQSLAQSPERKKELDALIASDLRALEPRVAKLAFRITPAPEGLEVFVNGALVPKAALGAPVPVDPGEPEVVVRAPGYREERLKLKLPEGVTHELVLGLVQESAPPVAAAPLAAAVPPPAPSSSAPTPAPPGATAPAPDSGESEPGSGQRTIGIVVGGAGIVALGVAAYFGVKTLVLVSAASSHCPDSVCDAEGYGMVQDANDAQTLGLVVGGVGAALFGTGIVIYATAASPDEKPSPTTAVVRLSPGGVTLGGTF